MGTRRWALLRFHKGQNFLRVRPLVERNQALLLKADLILTRAAREIRNLGYPPGRALGPFSPSENRNFVIIFPSLKVNENGSKSGSGLRLAGVIMDLQP